MTVKCDNCSNSADYTHSDPGVNPVNYCASCLPHWLRARAQAGDFPLVTKIVDDVVKPVEEEVKTSKKKSSKVEPVLEEATAPADLAVEETPAEEVATDESN